MEGSDNILRKINERITFLENPMTSGEATDRKRKRNEEEDARVAVEAEVSKTLMRGQASLALDRDLRRGEWVEQVIKQATDVCLRSAS